MPELPDIELYVHALRPRLMSARLERVTIASPFLLRTVNPPVEAAEGRMVEGLLRVGKRIAITLQDDVHLVVHLMIAGRLRWSDAPARGRPSRIALATLAFSTGTLTVTEAGTRKRAALHIVGSRAELERLDPGGLEVLDAPAEAFLTRLRRDRHTLKRALTTPAIFSGIGNAYSDEILHRARLSPFLLTTSLDDATARRLHAATVDVLTEWRDRLIADCGAGFPGPGAVTAFRPGMAVHGRFGRPCPVCGAPVQRVVFAEREFNYCAGCQTGGRVLADRSLSRLLRDDWPRTVNDLDRE